MQLPLSDNIPVMLAHAFRSPLAAATAALEVAALQDPNGVQHDEALAIAQKQIVKLSALVEDLEGFIALQNCPFINFDVLDIETFTLELWVRIFKRRVNLLSHDGENVIETPENKHQEIGLPKAKYLVCADRDILSVALEIMFRETANRVENFRPVFYEKQGFIFIRAGHAQAGFEKAKAGVRVPAFELTRRIAERMGGNLWTTDLSMNGFAFELNFPSQSL